jgi:hypothetical protein
MERDSVRLTDLEVVIETQTLQERRGLFFFFFSFQSAHHLLGILWLLSAGLRFTSMLTLVSLCSTAISF